MSAVRTAIVLAAGARLGAAHPPTPLLPLAGRALVDHALDRLATAGVERVVVHIADEAAELARHLDRRRDGPDVLVRREATSLETGGAVRAALDVLGSGPFFVVNGDTFWLDGPSPALSRLADSWRDAEPGPVLLMHRSFQVSAETGAGDFAMDGWGTLRRRVEREVVPYIYAGVQVMDGTAFGPADIGRFGMNRVWDAAIGRGVLRGVVHDGLWFHLATAADLAEAAHNLRAQALGEAR